MKSLTKAKSVFIVILFFLGAGNFSLLAGSAEKAVIQDKADTFPYSELGGIHLGMTLNEVIKKFGEQYKGSYQRIDGIITYGGPTWCIAYNDPSGKGSILIDTGETDKNDAKDIWSITLSTKPIPGAPKAKVSFLGEGTARGAKLGASMAVVKRMYPFADPEHYISDAIHTSVDLPPYYVQFWFHDKKVVKIWIGYVDGC